MSTWPPVRGIMLMAFSLSEPSSALDHLLGQRFQMIEELVHRLRGSLRIAGNDVVGDRAMQSCGVWKTLCRLIGPPEPARLRLQNAHRSGEHLVVCGAHLRIVQCALDAKICDAVILFRNLT